MRARIVSYTARGRDTAERAACALREQNWECRAYALPKFCREGDEPLEASAAEWAGEGFREADALVFCCAAGIAVRAIAPHVRDKRTDPAVVVLDETASYAIPLLGGHLGGANDLARLFAEALGAEAVLTTATDLARAFAVDVFAKRNGLFITDMALAKAVSAALLAGEAVGFRSDLPEEGALPAGLTRGEAELGIAVTAGRDAPFARTLFLVPRRYAAGVGCRRGKSAEELEAFVLGRLAETGVRPEELSGVASIDLKKDEPGLLALCERLGVPFETFSAERLREVPGEFTPSAFVLETTGVESVCERAAVAASGGALVVRKTAGNGMTFALAKREEGIRF